MIEGMDDGLAGLKIIHAKVPLSEMFGYATDPRSATQGRFTLWSLLSTLRFLKILQKQLLRNAVNVI